MAIKPCSFISRNPRNLKDLHNFKANEIRSFLLYFSRPCLFGLLDDKYLNNFCILSSSIYSLLSTEIKRSELDLIHTRLLGFVHEYEKLYESTSITMNVHTSAPD